MDIPDEIEIWRIKKRNVVRAFVFLALAPVPLVLIEQMIGVLMQNRPLWFLSLESPMLVVTPLMCLWQSRRLTADPQGLLMRTLISSQRLFWDEINVVEMSKDARGPRLIIRGPRGHIDFISLEGTERIMELLDERSKDAMVIDLASGTFLAPEKDGPLGKDETRRVLMNYLNRCVIGAWVATVSFILVSVVIVGLIVMVMRKGYLGSHFPVVILGFDLALLWAAYIRWKEGNRARSAWVRLARGRRC